MNNSNQRKIGVILSYISIILNLIIQLLYTPILLKSLGQSEYGLYSLVSSIIGYLSILDLGFGNAIVVYNSKFKVSNKIDEEKKLHGMFFTILFFIGIISFLLTVFIAFFSKNIFCSTMNATEIAKVKIMLIILAFNLLVTFIFSIFSSIIIAYESFIFQKVVAIVSIILKPLIMLPLLFWGFKSITLTIVVSIVNFAVCLLNYYYCKNKLKITIKPFIFDKIMFKTVGSYSVFIFLGIIVDKINWSVDQIVLGIVSGTIAVSVYSVASQISAVFINLSTAISGILLPKISKMVEKKASNEVITDEFIKVGRIQFIIIFLMASGLTLFGKEFFNAWVGEEYSSAYYIALILVLPVCIPLIQNIGISIMQAKNLHKFRSILYSIIAVLNIFVSIPLAKAYGGIGSAIGTGLSLIIGNGIIINIYYYKKVGINIVKFWKEIIKMAIPNIIPILIIIIFMRLISLHGYLNVIVFGVLYTIMYCAVSYFITMNDYEKGIVNKILIKVHLKKV